MNPQQRPADRSGDNGASDAAGAPDAAVPDAAGGPDVGGAPDTGGAPDAYGSHETAPADDGSRPLHRPVRWLVAAVELALAIGFVLLAAWAWRRSSIPVELPEFDNEAIPEFTSRQSGPWVAAAVGAALAAGMLVLDALRQVALAVRARTTRP